MEQLSTDSIVFAHLISRGRNRTTLFQYDDDRWFYLNQLSKESKALGVGIHAWVFMSNHIHILASAEASLDFSELLRRCNSLHARHFNKLRQRSGSLFEARPRMLPVLFDSYYQACHLYIELNPLRAGLATLPQEYSWSSCRSYFAGVQDNITTESGWFHQLGRTREERRLAYQRILKSEWGRTRP